MLRQTHVLPMISIHDAMLRPHALASVLLLITIACALPLSQAEEQPKSIPFEQLGAEAQKQDAGDCIGITPTALGSRLCGQSTI